VYAGRSGARFVARHAVEVEARSLVVSFPAVGREAAQITKSDNRRLYAEVGMQMERVMRRGVDPGSQV
jgi:type IV pilus biogenesis protein CpaD/CtpE